MIRTMLGTLPGTLTEGARRRWGVAAAGMAAFLNMYAPQSLLPEMAEHFGVAPAESGLLVTATLAAVAGVAPFAGGISDAAGRKRLVVGACVALGVLVLLSSLAPGFGPLVAFRFAEGLLLPFVFTVTVAYIADECEPDEGVATMSAYAIGAVVGGFLGRFVSGWVTSLAGWGAAFLALGALTLGCACAIAVLLPAERRFQPVRGWRRSLGGFADQFSNRQVAATCIMGFCVLFSMVASFTFVTLRLAEPPFDFGPAALGSMFVAYMTGVVATPVASGLVGRWGRLRTVQGAAALVAGGLLLTLSGAVPVLLAGLGLLCAGIFAQQVLSLGYAAAAARRARSTAVGLYATCYYAGGALGSIAPAWVWHQYGWPGCVALVLAVQGGAVLLISRVWPGVRVPA